MSSLVFIGRNFNVFPKWLRKLLGTMYTGFYALYPIRFSHACFAHSAQDLHQVARKIYIYIYTGVPGVIPDTW